MHIIYMSQYICVIIEQVMRSMFLPDGITFNRNLKRKALMPGFKAVQRDK